MNSTRKKVERRDAIAIARTGCVALFAVVLGSDLVVGAGTTFAGEMEPVESGRDALERTGAIPWYDAESDDVRPAEVAPPAHPPKRPDVESAKLPEPEQSDVSPAGFEMLWYVLQWTGWGLIALVILVLLVLVIRTLADRGRDAELDLPESSRRIVSDVDRMEQLPVPLKRDLSDLLGEARRQYEQGNFNEAIIYFYSYLLVELDRAQRIRLLRGKTNRQYLRELRDAPPTLSELVERTMIAFEDVFFGDRDLDRARFEACFGRLKEFQQYVEPVAA